MVGNTVLLTLWYSLYETERSSEDIAFEISIPP